MDIDAGAGEEKANSKPEVVVDASFDESAVYTGKVKFFKPFFRVTVVPDEGQLTFDDAPKKIEISVSHVHSSVAPAYLAKDQDVEFRLRKDNFGYYGIFLSGPGGAAIGDSEKRQEWMAKKKDNPARTAANGGQVYQGKITRWMTAQGFGYCTLNSEDGFVAPEISNEKEKKKFDKKKEFWFARDDINTSDAVVALKVGTEVQFTVYTDDKGIGAENLQPIGGGSFSGMEYELPRGMPKRKKKKKKKPQQQQKGKKRKNMENMVMIPIGGNMFGGNMMMGMQNMMQPQIMMVNGQPMMLMPTNMQQGPKKKKRKKNKNKKAPKGKNNVW